MINLTKKLLTQALDQCASGVLVVEAKGKRCAIVYANEAFSDLTGWDPGDLVGRGLRDFLAHGDLPSADASELEHRWRSRSDAPVELTLRVAPLYQRPGLPDYWMLSHPGPAAARDGRLREPAGTDTVSGLPNRRVFEDVLHRDWGMARRDGRGLAVILFQVDAMDSYRQVFGRHAADACLRKVGHAISGAMRRCGDLAARVDADRFAALVGAGSEEEIAVFAAEIADRVRGLAIHHPRSPAARFVTVSTGVAAMVPSGDEPADELFARSERSLESNLPPGDEQQASG